MRWGRFRCNKSDFELNRGEVLIMPRNRHFLNSVCTYTADIDYETIIMYVGGYDDMVVAKTQIRGRIEADNANREKKIAQLQEFIARSEERRVGKECRSRWSPDH